MSDLAAALLAFLRERAGGGRVLSVSELSVHTEGFSQETFSFGAEVERDGARRIERWVVKREPPAGLLEPYDL